MEEWSTRPYQGAEEVNTDGLTFEELLRYAEQGHVKGVHPDSARMLIERKREELALPVLLRELEGEVRPSVLAELKRKYA